MKKAELIEALKSKDSSSQNDDDRNDDEKPAEVWKGVNWEFWVKCTTDSGTKILY